ncbi:MAG TPA: hypothetical protein VL096_01735, partial [Pirellulaceae bacterium]|nr:hypothetical protein [Pirellulaceae bacterium]
LVTRETASIVDSTKKSEDLYMKRLAEKTKLEEDKANFTTELDVITKYETALNAKNDELRKQLKDTFILNQQLAAELARLQQQLADEINKAELAKTAAR